MMQWRENWWKCCCTCTCLVGRHSMKAEEKQIKFQAQNALPGCLPSKGEGLKMVKSTPATILVGEVPGKRSWRYANRNPVQFLDVGASQGGCSGKKKKMSRRNSFQRSSDRVWLENIFSILFIVWTKNDCCEVDSLRFVSAHKMMLVQPCSSS